MTDKKLNKDQREKMIDRLVNEDIEDIKQSLSQNDVEFLSRVLMGEGWVGYNNLTDKELIEEYNSREYEEE